VAILYDVVHLSIRRNTERSSGYPEFRVDVKGYKFKGITQERTMAIDHVSIYAYACIGLVGAAILGLLVFVWIALQKFRPIPRR
jgi:hypothetical protein